jgi:hypothetical protein
MSERLTPKELETIRKSLVIVADKLLLNEVAMLTVGWNGVWGLHFVDTTQSPNGKISMPERSKGK